MPPALEYAACSYLSLSPMAFINRMPVIANIGKDAKTTRVISQPVTKAKTKPAIKVPILIIKVEIFSPIAP